MVAVHFKATEMPDHIVQAENVASLAKWDNYVFLLCHMTLKIVFFDLVPKRLKGYNG